MPPAANLVYWLIAAILLLVFVALAFRLVD
jgi:hypothetical protein